MISREGVKNTPHWLAMALLASVALLGAVMGGTRSAASSKAEDSVKASLRRLPLSFEMNRGQAHEKVKFLSRGSGYTFLLTPTESYVLLAKLPKAENGNRVLPYKTGASALGMRLVGGNPAPQVSGEDALEGRANYLTGRDKASWRTDVETFGKVRYEEVYPGVDLVYYGNQQELEHDFIVSPGADPEQIRLAYRGARTITVDADGELLFHTDGGVVRQKRPYTYQKVNGERKEISSRYVVHNGKEVSFEVGRYDRSLPLVIDPVLRYSGYIGGTFDDYVFSIALDADRNVYLTGYTGSFQQDADSRPSQLPAAEGGPKANLPSQTPYPTQNALMGDPDRYCRDYDYTEPNMNNQNTRNPDATFCYSLYDAFVTKVNNSGTGLVFSTYLGAEGQDYGLGIAVDSNRSVYVTGTTTSIFWPLLNPAQISNGGSADAFVVKLNPAGNSFAYSTYIGANGNDRGRAIAVDATGNTHVAGLTSSTNFPTHSTEGAVYQSSIGGATDAFLLSLDASGSAFNYSTYVGGTGDEGGASPAIANSGLTYLPASSGLPKIISVPRGGVAGGPTNFPVGFDPLAIHLGIDYTVALTVDAVGNAYLAGGTTSTSFLGGGVPKATHKGGFDGFVAKFDPQGHMGTGVTGTYLTFLGGADDDAARAIAIDSTGAAFVTGYTLSSDFPLAGAKQGTFQGGASDAFVTKLSPNGATRVYSTYLGGNGEDIGNGIAVSSGGQAYVAGSTSSTNFPIFNFLQGSLRGGSARDVFVTKYRPDGADYEYSTYIGSVSRDDRGMAIAVDGRGQAYVTGLTTSGTYPFTLNNVGTFNTRTGSNYGPYPDADVFLSHLWSPPFAATNLDATTLSTTSIRLDFNDESDNEDGWEIERKDGSGSFTVVGVIGSSTGVGPMTYTDTGLNPGILYTYRIRSFNNDGATTFYGPYSNQDSAMTNAGQPLPASGLTVALTPPASVQLQWVDNSDNENGFRIEISTDDFGDPMNQLPSITVAANTTQRTINNLQRNTVFYFRVVAFNNEPGTPTPSPSVCALTLPNDATGLSVETRSSTELELTWTDNNPSGSGPSTFRIFRSDDNGKTYNQVATYTPPAPTAAVTFVNGGLTPNKVYFYRIRTTNTAIAPCVGGGDSPSLSNADSARTLPAAAQGLTVTVDSTTPSEDLLLNWTDNNNPPVQHRVERTTDNFTNEAPVTFPLLAAGITSFRDTTTEGNRTYYYRVIGRNAAGDAASSNIASELSLPSQPAGLTASVISDRAVELSWTDASFAPTQFRVERSVDGGSTWSQIAVTAVGVTTFRDGFRTTNQEYRYRVRGFNSSGNGAYSTVATITILPAPTALSAKALSPTQVRLDWVDNSNTETLFLIERVTGTSFATGTNPVSFTRAASAGTGATVPYTDKTVQANTTYVYRVTARRTSGGVLLGTSAPSREAGVTTPRVVPNAPTLVRVVSVSDTTLRVEYRDNSTDETGFKIERRRSGGTWELITTAPANAGSGTVLTYVDGGLTANTQYSYRLRATNGGDSAYSAIVTNWTRPAAPTNLVVSVLSRTSLRIYWRDNNTVGPVTYQVYRTATGGTWSLVTTLSVSAGGTKTYTDTGLQPNTNYTYKVRAVNPGGVTAYSNTASVKTLAALFDGTLKLAARPIPGGTFAFGFSPARREWLA